MALGTSRWEPSLDGSLIVCARACTRGARIRYLPSLLLAIAAPLKLVMVHQKLRLVRRARSFAQATSHKTGKEPQQEKFQRERTQRMQ